MEAIIIDTETTGTENPEVIELAWEQYPIVVFRERKTGWERFKPARPMQMGALATHHILPSELEGCAPASTAPGLVPKVNYWIGHNIDFDWRALGSPPVKRICTLAIARTLWPECDSHKLGAMMYHLCGKTGETREMVQRAHGAEADVELCRILIDHFPETGSLFNLHAFSEECRIPKIVSFGKYKGQPVSAVDRGWANWYLRQEDQDEYLVAALKRAGKV